MDGIRLRHAGVSDADAVAHVHRFSRAEYYDTVADPDDGREDMWSQLLAEPERATLLAKTGHEAVGFVSWVRVREPVPALELSSLYVLPEHAGTGVGSRLYDRFESERRDGEAGVLEVWDGNARAIDFYLRRGWVRTAVGRPGPEGRDYVTYRLTERHHEARRVTATPADTADAWTPEQLLVAVQARVRRGCGGDREIPMQAALDGSDVLVTFRWPGEPHLLGVRFLGSEAPVGPSTGDVCDSPAEWANEVGWVLLEELDTGLVHRGRRTVTDHGVVELHYRPAAD